MMPTAQRPALRLPRVPGWRPCLLVVTLCGFLIADIGSAQRSSARFDDSTTVLVVEVPVNVHRDGAAVRGLTRDDFVIREGRKEWPLVGFEVIDLQALDAAERPATVQASGPEVPIAARRHFLLLFDLSAGGLAGLDGARDLVESGLHPTDLVGVGVYGRAGSGLVLGFTADRQQVRATLDRLGGILPDGEAPPELARRDPLRLMPDTRAIDIAREALEMDLGGRGSNAEVYFDMDRANVAQGRARARAEVQRFSDALGALADATARIDGRKFLVLFSAGFDDDIFNEEELLSRRSLLDSREGSSALRDLQTMSDRFRKAGWTIQSVDAGGLQEGRSLSGGTSLALLASETGGETYRGFNDLGRAMDQMLGRTSVTYLLAFQADGVRIDGKYHDIEVELRDAPRGVRLLHRPGYYAPLPFDADRDDEEAAIDAMAGTFSVAETLLSGETGGEVEVETLIASFRGDGDGT
ncbi:MAG: VWA domain-containing protein, partial [Acidobacteriota bacterium]